MLNLAVCRCYVEYGTGPHGPPPTPGATKPDGCPKPDGFRFENLPADLVWVGFGWVPQVSSRAGFRFTRSEPDPLPSLLVRVGTYNVFFFKQNLFN
jgi:hypothetical protein